MFGEMPHSSAFRRNRRRLFVVIWAAPVLCWPSAAFFSGRTFAVAPLLDHVDALARTNKADSTSWTAAGQLEPYLFQGSSTTGRFVMGLMTLAATCLVLASLPVSAAEPVKSDVAGFAEFAEKGGAMDVNPGCFVTSCGKQTKECFVEDSRCLKGALCLSRCRGGQECATQCFAEYGCKRLDAWLNCTVEKEKCVSVPPQLIDVQKYFENDAPKKLANFDPSSLQGVWYKVRGYNPKYDCYLCQPNSFDFDAKTKTLKADIQLRVPKLKSGGFWQNNVDEVLVVSEEAERSTFKANGEIFGLSFDEEWYILAGDDDYKLVAYKGKNLQDVYEGAFIYTRTPTLSPETEAKAQAAAESNGYIWSKFCIVDNSCPRQTQQTEEAATLTWEDIPDLVEWFAPGTVPKKQFSGRYD